MTQETSKEWFTPWKASGFAVYDTRNQLVVHVGITGNRSMPGAQLERMAEMIADVVNSAAHEPETLLEIPAFLHQPQKDLPLSAQPPCALRDLLKPVEFEHLIDWHKACGECAERTDDFTGARFHRERRRELVDMRARATATKSAGTP